MIDARRRYIVLLAIAAATILAVGSLFRPAPAERGPRPTPSDLERLAQLAQRRAVEDSARYFAVVADRVAASLVQVDDRRLTGVVWAPGLVVTANPRSRPPETMTVTAFGRSHEGRTAGGGPHLPLIVLSAVSIPNLPAVRGNAAALEPGAWVLAVWRNGERRAFASGHVVGVRPRSSEFVQWDEVTSTVALTPDMRGGGLFDLDGTLLGVILPDEERLTVIAAASVGTLLEEARTVASQLLAQYGMRVGPPTEAEREHLRVDEGLVVREVWDGYAADLSGLAPGDAIASVNGVPVSALEDLSVLTGADLQPPPVLDVRWRSSAREVTLTAQREAVGTDARPGGLGWELPPQGLRIARVAPGSRAAHAGIRPGDRLLRIDGVEPRSLQQFERLLADASGTPRFLELRRGDRRVGVVF